MQNRVTSTKIDYLFIGAGAGATLLLLQLEKHGQLTEKTVVILDPELQQLTKKTFCFWAEPTEPIVSECQHMISHRWQEVNTPNNQPESIQPLEYLHIPGAAIHSELLRLINDFHIHYSPNLVTSVTTSAAGTHIHTEHTTWLVNTVFDSRPPQFSLLKPNQNLLYQSFHGYFIQLDTPIPNNKSIDLMDFDIDQMGNTQFVYSLPFSPNKLLVELTRFGKEVLQPADAEPLLTHYIHKRFGNFQLLKPESGCIPMCSMPLESHHLSPTIVRLGGAAGAIKPSTGYAFKRMFYHAKQLANSLSKTQLTPPYFPNNRFQFYDRLLLIILDRTPENGNNIFKTLFLRNKIKTVLSFLDEKTTIVEDLKIFSTLPLLPFLRALKLDLHTRFIYLRNPVVLLLITLSLLGLQNTTGAFFHWVQLLLGAAGFLLVGIPHGAIDHLLKNGSLQWKIEPGFIVRYLGTAASYLFFWLISPQLALILFLLYSAWHFGQTDLQEWKPTSLKAEKSFLWGATLLTIILLGHLPETNLILQNMNTYPIPLTEVIGSTTALVLALLSACWGIFERRPAIILSASVLGLSIQLPLLTAFGLYFIGQHSLNGWAHLKKGLNTNSKSLFLHALPFTGGALLLFGALLIGIERGWLNAFNHHITTAFFIFISCISFPHVLAMSHFYNNKLIASK